MAAALVHDYAQFAAWGAGILATAALTALVLISARAPEAADPAAVRVA